MAFGKIRNSLIRGEKGTIWYVDIYQKDFVGTSTEFDMQGEGFVIKWKGSGGTRDRTFIGSECVLNIYIQNNSDENFLYNDILKKGEKNHYIKIYKNGTTENELWWYGWIQPGFDAIQNTPYPYVSKITSTDSYGYYTKLKKDTLSGEGEKNQAKSIANHIFEFGSVMDIDGVDTPIGASKNWVRTAINWWRPQDYGGSVATDPFYIYGAAKGAFAKETKYDDEGNISNFDEAYNYKRSDVFDGCLKTFNTIGFLAEGFYTFLQPNSLFDNEQGTLSVVEGGYQATIPSNINTVLTIDQSSNVILGGSAFTYEPSYESVTADFVLGGTDFFISPSADLTTSFVPGGIQVETNQAEYLTLDFSARHIENFLASDFTFGTTAPDGGPYSQTPTVRNSSFLTTATLVVSVTNGTTTKYLTNLNLNTPNQLKWVTNPASVIIARGYNNASVNNALQTSFSYGLLNNTISTQGVPVTGGSVIIDDSTGPCSAGITPGSFGLGKSFSTNIRFIANIEPPNIQGDISIQLTASNDYYQVGEYLNGQQEQFSYQDITNPTPGSESTTCVSINLSVNGNTEFEDVSGSFQYSSSQTEVPSSESYDLGEIKLGGTELNKLYSIQKQVITQWQPVVEFQVGNPAVPNLRNITQLLTHEFLALQIEPLEILQAEIQSNNISPLRLLKYSLNDDEAFKLYSFLGGTFKAQSEIMSGEWYNVGRGAETTIIVDDTPESKSLILPNTQTPSNIINQNVLQTSSIYDSNLASDNYGITDTIIDSGFAIDKFEIDGLTSAKIYDNQKLRLSYPDGTNSVIVTSRSEIATGVTQILVDSFIPNLIYPIGSVISCVNSDLTNVITGGGTPGGSNKEVQFNDSGAFGAEAGFEYDKTTDFLSADNIEGRHYGENTGFRTQTVGTAFKYMLAPSDFSVSANLSANIYTRNSGGSVQPDSNGARDNSIFAMVFLPIGYRITGFRVSTSSSLSVSLTKGDISNTTITNIFTGTSNQGNSLTTAETIAVNKYYLLKVGTSATSDAIYGGEISLEKI